jgi:hypothetical protein
MATTPLCSTRDAGAHASLDDPSGVGYLLRALREAGASGQVTTLASRATAHTSLDNPDRVAYLLVALGEAVAQVQAAELIERLPAAGMFQLFLRQQGRRDKHWSGREANDRPAKPWTWTDLG